MVPYSSSFKPLGNEPDFDHVIGFAPVASRTATYAVPVSPSGSETVLITGFPVLLPLSSFTLRVNVLVVSTSPAMLESSSVKVKVPVSVGLPVSEHVLLLLFIESVRPLGRVPPVFLHSIENSVPSAVIVAL